MNNNQSFIEKEREPELENIPEPDYPEPEHEPEEPDIPEEPAEDYGDDGCPGDIMPDFWTCEFNQEHEMNESCHCEPELEIEEEPAEEITEDYEQ